MARGKKREKRPNYVGSKGELKRDQEEKDRRNPTMKKQRQNPTIYLKDAGMLMGIVAVAWVAFFMVDCYVIGKLALMIPVTCFTLVLLGWLHFLSPKCWVKSPRYRGPMTTLLFALFFVSIVFIVYGVKVLF